ncbi:MAG: hypothetical protein ABI793_03245 [Flavobacterium sp.]
MRQQRISTQTSAQRSKTTEDTIKTHKVHKTKTTTTKTKKDDGSAYVRTKKVKTTKDSVATSQPKKQ